MELRCFQFEKRIFGCLPTGLLLALLFVSVGCQKRTLAVPTPAAPKPAIATEAASQIAPPTPTPAPPKITPKPIAPAPPNAPAATPAAVRKPLGDYVPCLFTGADDSFLRGRSLSDAMKSLASQQVLIGRLDPSNAAQAAAILLSAGGAINSGKTAGASAPAVNAVIDSLFDNNLLHPARTDNGDQSKAKSELALALTAALQAQAATQVSSTLDVGCSQSLLSWDEARDIFGARIANTYLAVQVTIRNLNPSEEFLMHDVQIALDATTLPINVTFGQSNLNQAHFVAGRDKMLVRGVAMVGQQMDHRNFLIRVAEALGDVTLAAATLTGRAHFIDGVSIYKSVLIPGFKSVYPDLTIDQLNRLNDLAFSSSSAYKIVVPKSGSVPFVTFLPAKIFAAAPNTSGAGTKTPGNAWQYKKWTQEQMLLLQESLYVVFAGAHVVEDTGSATAIQ